MTLQTKIVTQSQSHRRIRRTVEVMAAAAPEVLAMPGVEIRRIERVGERAVRRIAGHVGVAYQTNGISVDG